MLKITDSSFKLPNILAVTAQEVLYSGTTNPIIISGISDENNSLGFYIVKPKGNGRMIGSASMRELLASFICLELGLNIPSPAIIQITNEFIESTRFSSSFTFFQNSSGNNFGSKYVEGFISISEDNSLFKRFYSELQKILVFDIFISTSDRRKLKPNMALYDDSVYIYDHELSFSFVHDIFPNPEPWRITNEDKTAIEGHILFNFYKSKPFECESFMKNFTRLNDDFWNKAVSYVPADLLDIDQFNQIKNNLTSKINNLVMYLEEIKKVLL